MIMEQHITDELISMDKRLTELEETMREIDGKLTQVVDAILGNPLTKQGGFIEEIEYLRKDIDYLKGNIQTLQKKSEAHDLFKNRIMWTIGVIIIIGAILQYIGNFYFKMKG